MIPYKIALVIKLPNYVIGSLEDQLMNRDGVSKIIKRLFPIEDFF